MVKNHFCIRFFALHINNWSSGPILIEQNKMSRWLFPEWKYPLHAVNMFIYAFVLAVNAFFFQFPLL